MSAPSLSDHSTQVEDNTDYQDSGLVHNMLDKFENATLLIRLGLPSTLQHTNTHKEISQNRTFWICSLEWNNLKTQLFSISVDGELFVSGTFWIRLHHFVMWFNFSSLSWSLIWHGRQHDVFCVIDNNFLFNRLFIRLHEYCMPENQEWLNEWLVSKDTRKATRRSQPYKQRCFWTQPGRASAWWDNFVNDIVVTEDWRENFRISWSNMWKLSKLLQPHIEGKTTRMRCLVDITKKVAWTLYYLSNRGCLRKTTNAFGLSHQVSSFQNHKESLQELRLTRQRSNLPTSTRQHIKSSRDIGELVLNPIQLIRT